MKYLKYFDSHFIPQDINLMEPLFVGVERTYVVKYTHTKNGYTDTSFYKRLKNIDDALTTVGELKKSFMSLDLRKPRFQNWTLDNYYIEEHGKTSQNFDAFMLFMDKDAIDAAIEGQKYNL